MTDSINNPDLKGRGIRLVACERYRLPGYTLTDGLFWMGIIMWDDRS